MYRLILKVPIKLIPQALFPRHAVIILLATLLIPSVQAALTITPQGPGGVTGEPVTITTTEPTDAGSAQQQPTQTVNTQQQPLDTIDATPINDAPFQTLPLAPPVPAEAVAGRLLIKFKQKPAESFSPAETGDPQLNELMQRFQVKSVRPLLSTADSIMTPSTITLKEWSIYIAEFPEDVDVNAAATAFSATLATEYAEPDYVAGVFAQPNDPHFSFQWGLYNLGQTGGSAGADVSAPEGWEINTGSEAITLAIVDTGVDVTHEDLKDNIVPGYDFYNDDADPSDDHGHGTFVAGIAAAQTHNEVGIAGVCWHCRIMPIKVLNNNGFGSLSTVAQGIVYAVEHGAQVINLSLGSAKLSSVIQDAVAFANSQGVSIVAGVGNHGTPPIHYPAKLPETIAVGATDHNDIRWSNSAYGAELDLMAPGRNILSTFFNNLYIFADGTSMATPFVTGAVGLLKSLCPQITPEEIRSVLKETADDLGPVGWDEEYGAGRLNIETMLAFAQHKNCQFTPFNPLCSETPTIRTLGNGEWLNTATWDLERVPDREDVVLIQTGHTVTLPGHVVRVKSVCNHGELSSQQDQPLFIVSARSPGFFDNYGKVLGKSGRAGEGSQCAQAGSDVLLKIKAGSLHNYPPGIISSGDGGNGSSAGCPAGEGGRTLLLASQLINEGAIGAGEGGQAPLNVSASQGGEGGRIYAKGSFGAPGELVHAAGAFIQAGKGGDGQIAGRGGKVKLGSLPTIQLNGEVYSGAGGNGATPGRYGRIVIDPQTMLFGTEAKVGGGEIMITCGKACDLNLSQLNAGTIAATEDITLAVGEGSQINLSGSAARALQAQGQVNIFADHVLTDETQSVSEIMDAQNGIVSGESKIIREVTLHAPSQVSGAAGEQLTLDLTLTNDGPGDDSYRFTVDDKRGWSFNGLPEVIHLEGGGIADEADGLVLPLNLPTKPGARNTIIVTATSRADRSVSSTVKINVTVAQESERVAILTPVLIPISDQPGGNLPPCPTSGYIDWMCSNYGRVITDAQLGPFANVAGGILAGNIDNQGIVSQVTLETDAVLSGGKVTGFVVNQGTIRDINFVGAEIKGGTLAGHVLNNSPIHSRFTDVCLAAESEIRGGFLQGQITAEQAQIPAALMQLTVQAGSQLSSNIVAADTVVIADDVESIAAVAQCGVNHVDVY